ncbi:hypothetical protein B0T25DRAFT_528885 [Lasiosphaeria hispida]|uniref:Uncharacterized protein n=1 Tax=Lasiosphaeria hispida TaxID=260671 RepID=A0AAJ0HWH9_9PEZI|nr:hypothetical protein B0T25DRAFT_528885 [Lasiosphaeria hispida]
MAASTLPAQNCLFFLLTTLWNLRLSASLLSLRWNWLFASAHASDHHPALLLLPVPLTVPMALTASPNHFPSTAAAWSSS